MSIVGVLYVLLLVPIALCENAWYYPHGYEVIGDFSNNLVFLNGSIQNLMFHTTIPEWTLTMYQFDAPNKFWITSQAADGPNFTVPCPISLTPFSLSAPLMFAFHVAGNTSDAGYTLNSHWFNVTTDPTKVSKNAESSALPPAAAMTTSTYTESVQAHPIESAQAHPTESGQVQSTTNGTAIGLGVGLGIGLPILIAVIGVLYFLLRRLRSQEQQINRMRDAREVDDAKYLVAAHVEGPKKAESHVDIAELHSNAKPKSPAELESEDVTKQKTETHFL